MGRKARKYTHVVDDDILVMDKPSLYMAKWRTKLVKVILRSVNNDGTYKVTSPNSNNYWTVPELFHQDTASTEKGTEAEEVRKYTQCAWRKFRIFENTQKWHIDICKVDTERNMLIQKRKKFCWEVFEIFNFENFVVYHTHI